MPEMNVAQDKMHAIATAYTDYTKSAFEANKAYLEKLATVKDPSQAMELTTSHMKASYEAFVAEAAKIQKLYQDFFQTALKPMTDEARKLGAVN
jgi:hypothetical protein